MIGVSDHYFYNDFQIFCKIVAILLHYFSLASFCWMLMEAAMLYLKLISVFGGEYIQIRKFCAFGWGMYSLHFSWN